MKRVMVLFFAAMVAFGLSAKEKEGVKYDAVVVRAIDGDTIVIQANWIPDPMKKEIAVRIFGVDTPEKGWRGKCDKEKAAGDAASAFTKKLIEKSKKVEVILMDWDKFGGRVLGDMLFDGKSLRKELIANGFAREYYGEAKESWCD